VTRQSPVFSSTVFLSFDCVEAVLEVAHVSNVVVPADHDLVRVVSLFNRQIGSHRRCVSLLIKIVAVSAVTLHVIVSVHAVRAKRKMAIANVKMIGRRRILANGLKHLDPPRVLDRTQKNVQCPVEDQRILSPGKKCNTVRGHRMIDFSYFRRSQSRASSGGDRRDNEIAGSPTGAGVAGKRAFE
jgi:hypothetical protein